MLKLVATLLLPAALLGLDPAQAKEMKAGTGVICNTEAQVQRLIAAGPKAAEATIAAINVEEPKACGIVPVIYVERTAHETVRNPHGTFRIVEIIVVGVTSPQGVQPVPPLAQFTFVTVRELSV
jgi:hypothetical protein